MDLDKGMNATINTKYSFLSVLVAGTITALAAALLNALYDLCYTTITGIVLPGSFSIYTVMLASFVPGIIASLIYYGLTFYTAYPRVVFYVGGTVFLLLSLVGPLSPTLPNGQPVPTGFVGLAMPLHVIAGAVILIAMPHIAQRLGFKA